MKLQWLGLVIGLLLGWGGCSARSVEEEEGPDIEGLCLDFCERHVECGLPQDDEHTTVEACIQACSTSDRWAPECAELREDLLLCQVQFECPEFGEARAEQCQPELLADGNCWPEERP